jgi:hypothetical protein
MTSREYMDYLGDILESACLLEVFVESLTFDEF